MSPYKKNAYRIAREIHRRNIKRGFTLKELAEVGILALHGLETQQIAMRLSVPLRIAEDAMWLAKIIKSVQRDLLTV